MPRFLVTGTDTGIGKTTVATAIVAALRRRRVDVGVCKPAETGCETPSGELRAADAERLRYFAGCAEPIESICPFRLRAPLAPAVAARREGVTIELPAVAAAVERIAAAHATALVEGAGGLLVPLTDSATFADLARACGLRLVIVVGNRLGAINHALLTWRVAEAMQLDVAGYIVNTLQPQEDLAARTNIDTLRQLIGPPLGVFPWVGCVECTDAERDRLADAAERGLALDVFV